MIAAALQHRSSGPFAYPAGPDRLRVVLKAARGDLASAECFHADRYVWPAARDEQLSLQRLADDGLHDYWAATLPAPTRRVRYCFALTDRSGDIAWLSEAGLTPSRPSGGHFQYAYITVADRFEQPAWVKDGAVFYQIFPDRFCNGDPENDPPRTMAWGDLPKGAREQAGGDLAGIRQRLGYLRDLGVTALYCTPLFQSPTNHKYDTTDYYRIDPQFGTNEAFKALVAEAHGAGIRVLLDAVFNHSGKDWFAFADVMKRGRKSPYVDWFARIDSFPVRPRRWNYESFAIDPNMPKLNTANPELAGYLLDVAEYWIREADIDGWRLDVANEVDHRFWRAFRDRVKGVKPDAWILGEVWHDAAPWLQGDQFDSSMNYPWREAVLNFLKGNTNALDFDRALTRLRFHHPAEVSRGMLNLLGTHDTARVRTEVGSREGAALAALLLFTAPGVPLIYYGDEIGMEGRTDPDCRRCYPWDRADQQDAGILSLYRRLIAIRRRLPWLGDVEWATCLADGVNNVYAYRRDGGEGPVWVVVNNGARERTASMPLGRPVAALRDLLAGEMLHAKRVSVRGGTAHVTLPPRSGAILAPKELHL